MRGGNKYLVFIAFLFTLNSCHLDCHCLGDIELSESMIAYGTQQEPEYCKLIERSLKVDTNAIQRLSLIIQYDGLSYEHGEVLIEVLDKISERKFINAIKHFSPEQKNIVRDNFLAGFEHIQLEKYNGKNISSLPSLNAFLMSK